MAGFLSDVDDFVNEKVPGGWYSLAALLGYNTMPMGGASGAGGGFSWLPSGEMTIADGAGAVGGSSGGTNFLSSLFGGSQELAPMGNDYSRMVEMYPTSSGNIFEPSGMSSGQLDQLNMQGMLSKLQQSGNQRPWELDALKMLMPQQQQPQKEEEQVAQLKRGSAIPQSVLSSLLDPKVALKAYRPTLI
jgi:hypothetical protein